MPARLNVRSIIRGNKTCAPHSPAGQKLGLKHGYQFTAPDLHEIVPVVCAASGGAFEFVSRKAAGGAGAAVLINIANLVAQGYFDAARSDERAWLEKQAEWEGTHRKAWDEHHKEGRVNSRIHSELEKMREEFVTAKFLVPFSTNADGAATAAAAVGKGPVDGGGGEEVGDGNGRDPQPSSRVSQREPNDYRARRLSAATHTGRGLPAAKEAAAATDAASVGARDAASRGIKRKKPAAVLARLRPRVQLLRRPSPPCNVPALRAPQSRVALVVVAGAGETAAVGIDTITGIDTHADTDTPGAGAGAALRATAAAGRGDVAEVSRGGGGGGGFFLSTLAYNHQIASATKRVDAARLELKAAEESLAELESLAAVESLASLSSYDAAARGGHTTGNESEAAAAAEEEAEAVDVGAGEKVAAAMLRTARGVCVVDGCGDARTPLSRCRTCPGHKDARAVSVGGVRARECITCRTLHPLTAFKDGQRNCRMVQARASLAYKRRKANV